MWKEISITKENKTVNSEADDDDDLWNKIKPYKWQIGYAGRKGKKHELSKTKIKKQNIIARRTYKTKIKRID